jgi:hypothetical protein
MRAFAFGFASWTKPNSCWERRTVPYQVSNWALLDPLGVVDGLKQVWSMNQ